MTIQNICFIGAGHVGAPTATIFAFFNPNLQVTVVDKSDHLIRRWNSRHIPLRDEPGLRYLVRITRDGTLPTLEWSDDDDQTVERPARRPNLTFSSDIGGCVAKADMVFLCVETPTRMEGVGRGMAAETSSIEKAVEEVAEFAKEGVVVVVKSTVPVGTAELVKNMITKARPHMPCEVLSNPEFLSEGEAVKNLLNPDRVLLGPSLTSPGYAAASTLASIYSSWIDPAKIQVMSSTSAELAKLAANAMLAQRISSINAISTICERTCADIADVQAALGSDSRIGSDYLQASIGFGGSCLKKDLLNLVYLTRSLNLPNTGEYWLHVLRMNHFQTANLVQRVVSRLDGSLSDKKVAILGWTFKRGTSDTRDTRSAHVLKMLLENSATEIAIFDPGCNPADIQEEVYSVKRSVHTNPKGLDNNVLVHENPYAACQGADATLVLTDWDHFRCPPGPGKPFLVPLGDAEKVDAFGSASDISWTDCASSEIGLSLSMLSIGDTDQFDHRKSFVRNPLGRLKPDRPCPSNCRDCTKPSWWGETNHRVDWRRIAAEMKSPRWVFDGRNVVDIGEMGRMGFRVEALGKASAWGPF